MERLCLGLEKDSPAGTGGSNTASGEPPTPPQPPATCTGGSAREERQNCAYKCVSPSCFARHVGGSPLEEGEVDDVRRARFGQCAEQELRIEAVRSRWSAEENVTPEERRRSDAEWVDLALLGESSPTGPRR